MTDNGPRFSSNEFQVFARGWAFNYVTTSPRYPQSNGKVENAVRTVKRLFEKCKNKKPVWQNLKLFLTGELRLLRGWIPAWHSA